MSTQSRHGILIAIKHIHNINKHIPTKIKTTDNNKAKDTLYSICAPVRICSLYYSTKLKIQY